MRVQLANDRPIDRSPNNHRSDRPSQQEGRGVSYEPAGAVLRARGGRVCPRCRYSIDGETTPASIPRCPVDGAALVSARELLQADGDPFLGTTVAGRFVIIGRLGAGSMGTVYRARQQAVGRDVAIKILRSDRAVAQHAKARFAREAHAMSLLTSPHTVTVFDFGEIVERNEDELGGTTSLYLAMELLEGESLGARLKRCGRLAIPDAVQIARHALYSLMEAHAKGIIHRDLKPDNLFLMRAVSTAQGEICKVLDFGIAKVKSMPTSVDLLETQAGTVFGTPRYMSPEQAQGKAIDARSDLYTLAVLLYQMLVGRAPFIDDDAVVVMARHIKSRPVPPIEAAPEAGISPALSALVMRALAKDPADRPDNAQVFLAELERSMATQTVVQGSLPAAADSAMAAVRWRASRRVKTLMAATLSVAAWIAVMIASRPSAKVSVLTARTNLGVLVKARLQALAPVEPLPTTTLHRAAPAQDALTPPAPGAVPVTGPKKGGKRYKRFE